MENLDIKDFSAVSGVSNTDYVLLAQGSGSNGKILVSLLKKALAKGITPSIGDNGNWMIGDTDTGVLAAVQSIEFRTGEIGIEFRTGESEWKIAISYESLMPAIRERLYKIVSEEEYDKMIEQGTYDPDMIYLTEESL